MERNWIQVVNKTLRYDFLNVLKELSKIKEKDFVLIGSSNLLMHDYIRREMLWDIDLLFKDKESILSFDSMIRKKDNVKIVNQDEGLEESEQISSLHSFWSYSKKRWINVDYITKPFWHDFFEDDFKDFDFYKKRVQHQHVRYNLNLPVAHPWAIFIEKTLSPRCEESVRQKDCLSYDVRDIFAIIEQDQSNPEFMKYIGKKTDQFDLTESFKESLTTIIDQEWELGYSLTIEDNFRNYIDSL